MWTKLVALNFLFRFAYWGIVFFVQFYSDGKYDAINILWDLATFICGMLMAENPRPNPILNWHKFKLIIQIIWLVIPPLVFKGNVWYFSFCSTAMIFWDFSVDKGFIATSSTSILNFFYFIIELTICFHEFFECKSTNFTNISQLKKKTNFLLA